MLLWIFLLFIKCTIKIEYILDFSKDKMSHNYPCKSITIRHAIVVLSRCTYYYPTKLLDDSMIILILSDIAEKHLRWGAEIFYCIGKLAINRVANVFIGCIVS